MRRPAALDRRGRPGPTARRVMNAAETGLEISPVRQFGQCGVRVAANELGHLRSQADLVLREEDGGAQCQFGQV